jgi:hypothetical protein
VFKRLAVRGGLALLGMGVTLAWWTIHPGKSNIQSVAHIPAKVLDGGNSLEIEVESSTDATMRVSFSDLQKPAGSQELVESWEQIHAGPQSWRIDVPSGVGGYIELGATKPIPGDKLTMKVKVNGELVDDQSESLDSPLESGTAFFVQDHFDDYSKAKEEVGAVAGEQAVQ